VLDDWQGIYRKKRIVLDSLFGYYGYYIVVFMCGEGVKRCGTELRGDQIVVGRIGGSLILVY